MSQEIKKNDPPLPVATEEFWRRRVWDTVARGRELHTIIYDTDPDTWKHIQNETAGILQRHLQPGMKFLDAGCGYGAVLDIWDQYPVFKEVEYHGYDLSPDLIGIGKIRYPEANLFAENLFYRLEDKEGTFDVALVRSVEIMLKKNINDTVWRLFLRRVCGLAKTVVLMDYGSPSDYQIVEGS